MKKSAKMLLYFDWRMRDAGISYSRAIIQRTVDVFLAFLEHGSAEKIAV
jgi:hypothetical protein